MPSRIELIGIHNIEWDERFQCRHKTNHDYAQGLSAAIAEGSVPPPCDVFRIPGREKLVGVAGFHRAIGAKNAGQTQLRCVVHQGAEEDALAFAAGSNRDNVGLQMTKKDAKKACLMLLGIEFWRKQPSNVIARHVGVTGTTASKWVSEYFSANGIPFGHVLDKGGRVSPRSARSALRVVDQAGRIFWNKTRQYVGKHLAGQVVDSREFNLPDSRRTRLERFDAVMKFFTDKGFYVERQVIGRDNEGCTGLTLESHAISVMAGDWVKSRITKFWTVLAIKTRLGLSGRCVVLAYDAPESELTRVANKMGIEILTPEEFVESLKQAESA